MRDALRGVWACHVRSTRDCSLEMPRKRRRVKLVKCGLPSGAALSLVRDVSGRRRITPKSPPPGKSGECVSDSHSDSVTIRRRLTSSRLTSVQSQRWLGRSGGLDWLALALDRPCSRGRSLGAADFAPSPARRGFRHWTTAVASARRADREDGTRTRTRARRAQTRRAQTRRARHSERLLREIKFRRVVRRRRL